MTKQDALQRVRGFLATRFGRSSPDWMSGRELILMAMCEHCLDRKKVEKFTIYSVKGGEVLAEFALHSVLAQMLWETQDGETYPREGIFDHTIKTIDKEGKEQESPYRFHVAHGIVNALALTSRPAPTKLVLSSAS